MNLWSMTTRETHPLLALSTLRRADGANTGAEKEAEEEEEEEEETHTLERP
jgi:hypothetical protein